MNPKESKAEWDRQEGQARHSLASRATQPTNRTNRNAMPSFNRLSSARPPFENMSSAVLVESKALGGRNHSSRGTRGCQE